MPHTGWLNTAGMYSLIVLEAGAKLLQFCPTLRRREELDTLLCPWESPGKNTGVGCLGLLQCLKLHSSCLRTASALSILGLGDVSLKFLQPSSPCIFPVSLLLSSPTPLD